MIRDFSESPIGDLVPISLTDRRGRQIEAKAYSPHPLGEMPVLSGNTWRRVTDASRELGRLSQSAKLLANPGILARPTLRREAESTSALEGTFAPLEDIVAADARLEGLATTLELTEVLNYMAASDECFAWLAEGRRLTPGLLCSLHATLVRGTPADNRDAGRVRSTQVVIGARGGSIESARFVPPPPGRALEAALADLLEWMHREPDNAPVVEAAMAHYQFETIHPFNDGNGRLGRLLIAAHLLARGELASPMLSVSPWFERRRPEYQDGLAEVSATGRWDPWVSFFAEGIAASAADAARRFEGVLAVEKDYLERVRATGKRGAIERMPELLIEQPIVTVRWLSDKLGMSYQGASALVPTLVEIGILREVPGTRPARYIAFDALDLIAG